MEGQVPGQWHRQPEPPLWLLCYACSVPGFAWHLCPWMGIWESCPPQGGKKNPVGSCVLHLGRSGHKRKGKSCCVFQSQRTERENTSFWGFFVCYHLHVRTAQKLSIDDEEVTEGARRVCPRRPAVASAAALHGKVLVLEIRAPWRYLFVFLLFFFFFFAPSLSSCFVAISGFEARLAPEVPSQKHLLFFFLVISQQNYCVPGGEKVFEAIPCSSRVWRCKGASFNPGPSAAGCPRSVVSAGGAERWAGRQGRVSGCQLALQTKLQAT